MPTTAEPTARGFTLADFPDPTNVDTPPVETPVTPETPVDTPAEPTKPAVEETAPPEPKPEDEAQSLNDAMDRQLADAERTEKEKADEEKRAKAEAQAQAAAEKAEAEAKAQPPSPTDPKRDGDLDKIQLSPHTHERTRKQFDATKALTRAARNERDQVVAEREALRKERDELAQKVKSTEPPKELVDEIATLKERIRELDISKDPELETKYDAPIKASQQAIVDVLKAQGFGMTIDPESKKQVENPAAIAALMRSGLTYENLHPLIEKLRAGGLHGEARKIEQRLSRIESLEEEKQGVIQSWKGSHDQRLQQREAQTKQAQAERQQAIAQHSQTIFERDVDALAKTVPSLRRPAPPMPGDAPNVAKAKQAAVDEYSAAEAAIAAELKTLSFEGVAPEKQVEIAGKISANAQQAIVLKTAVIPRLQRDMAARDARIKELEAQVAKYENAGKLSRAQGYSPGGAPNGGRPEPTSLDEALGAGPS